MNIVCFGDSITHAGNYAEGDKWVTILQNKLNEWKQGKYKVHNRGMGGSTTADGFRFFPDEVLPLLPAVVLIEFGYNDCNVQDWTKIPRVSLAEYKNKLAEFHRLIKMHKGKPVFIVNHPVQRTDCIQGNRKSYNTNFKPYNPAIKEIAKKLRVPIIDLPEIIRKRRVDLKTFLNTDGLHLSLPGNHVYADMVFEALKKIL